MCLLAVAVCNAGVVLWLEMLICCFWASLVGVKLYRWSRGRLSFNSAFGPIPAKTLQWWIHWFYFSEILKSWQCHCNNAHRNKVTSGFYTVLLTLVVWFLQNLGGGAGWNDSVWRVCQTQFQSTSLHSCLCMLFKKCSRCLKLFFFLFKASRLPSPEMLLPIRPTNASPLFPTNSHVKCSLLIMITI